MFVDMMSTRPKFLLQHILQYKASDGEVGEAAFLGAQALSLEHTWLYQPVTIGGHS